MLIVGLTGSIGMGKSVTADMFRARAVPVFDADAAVHALYAGPAAAHIEEAFPGTLGATGIDREKLSRQVIGDAPAMGRLEAIVHPLVHQAENAFLAEAAAAHARIVVLDIPLLLENGADDRCDVVAVVSAPEDVQRARVLDRPGMSAEKFEAILARQMPDAQKRRRAHVLIPSGRGFEAAQKAVDDLLRAFAAVPGSAYANRLALR